MRKKYEKRKKEDFKKRKKTQNTNVSAGADKPGVKSAAQEPAKQKKCSRFFFLEKSEHQKAWRDKNMIKKGRSKTYGLSNDRYVHSFSFLLL